MLRRLLFLLSVVIFSDTNSVFGQEISCEGNNIEFNKTEEIILQDDLFPFDNSGAVLVSDSHMFLAFYNPASVIIFDREGKQIGIVGGKGRGPQELLMPSILNKKENDFVVWDAAQMKFVVFDTDGEAYAELSGVKQSIGSFFFSRRKTVYL